ncbi:hypothetical protein XENTR_v10007329 [Xenopus tropicalis]|nr:hypothetical protein XENTR_v10007329 [Xenopus tropicalis]
MQNSTPHPAVLLLGFGEMTSVKYLYCSLILIGYSVIILLNSAVIAVTVLHETLQRPMYIFISAFCINGLYGSTAFFPSVFINLFKEAQTISYGACILQDFAVNTYGGSEMTLLAVMAFDRYVSICHPLRYNSIMSLPTVFRLIGAAWLYPFILVSILVLLTVRLPLCDWVILKIYCDNWSVVRLSCVDTSTNNAYGILCTVAILVVMPILIVISYIAILRVCAKSSKDFQAKALQTCAPHLLAIATYLVDVLFEIFLYRYSPTSLPPALRVFMSIHFLVVPPLLNPLIYGLKIRELRVKINKLLQKQSIPLREPKHP